METSQKQKVKGSIMDKVKTSNIYLRHTKITKVNIDHLPYFMKES